MICGRTPLKGALVLAGCNGCITLAIITAIHWLG